MNHADIIIVGSGHAGAHAAIGLRQNGHEGTITMIGREREPPYERPPLSKEYLAREKPFERLYIRPPEFWAEKNIDLRLGSPVVALDPVRKTVTLADDSQLSYRKLIWATGGDARRLSCVGADLDGVFTVRNRDDADRIMARLDAGANKAIVIGGGYIGLEAAAVLRKMGRQVTVIEALPRVLARVAGEDLSIFYEKEHCAQGVDLRVKTKLDHISGADGAVSGVVLEGGEKIAADLVIAGIGIVPSVGPLITAGASGANGVDVDEFCRTSLDDIYAIGDCAAHVSGFADGAVVRVESVQNANDMAVTTAKTIMGGTQPYRAFPWFWSNQYDLRLQTAGLSIGFDQTILRGDPADRKFSVLYLKEGRVIALDCVNNTKDYVQGRKLVEARAAPSAAELADIEIPLKTLV